MVAAFKQHTEFSCGIFRLGSLLDEPKPGSFVNHNIVHCVNPSNCGLAKKTTTKQTIPQCSIQFNQYMEMEGLFCLLFALDFTCGS